MVVARVAVAGREQAVSAGLPNLCALVGAFQQMINVFRWAVSDDVAPQSEPGFLAGPVAGQVQYGLTLRAGQAGGMVTIRRRRVVSRATT